MDAVSRRGFVGTLGVAIGAGCLPYAAPALAAVPRVRVVPASHLTPAELIRSFEQALA